MKRIKYFAALLTVTAVCLSSFLSCGRVVPKAEVRNTHSVQQEMDDAGSEGEADTETDPETVAYICGRLIDTLGSYDTKLTISGHVSKEEMADAVRVMKDKAPDIFWMNGYTITTDSTMTQIEFRVLNGYTADDLSYMHTLLEEAADEIISQIPDYYDDYEKILYVHDQIIEKTEYDTSGAAADRNGIWGTSYGCLVNGKAVCQGYAEAFTYVMNRLGIENGFCCGDSYRGRHAWNYVKVDGEYYWIDVTWDDPESDFSEEGELRHTYFLINDEMLLRTRSLDPVQKGLPECTSLKDNYFQRNGAYFSSYSSASMGRLLASSGSGRTQEYMFSDEKVYKEAVKGLFEEDEIWELGDYVELGEEICYSQDDMMYVIKIGY